MPDKRYQQYDIEALHRRIPEDESEFFIGFVPWVEDCEGWIQAPRRRREEKAAAVLRTAWNNPSSRNSRVLIDVLECHSAGEAMQALVDVLANNQLARIPEGPPALGRASFVHPEGVPPAVFFARGNLAISVASLGRDPVYVLSWAERLNARLSEAPPQAAERIGLETTPHEARTGQETELSYAAPYPLGEDGYWKFFATGATFVRRGTRLFLRAPRPGVVRVEAFAVEPGREPYAGRLAIAAK